MKVALQTVSDKYDAKLMKSWKIDLERAFVQLAPITIIKPTAFTPIMRGSTVAGAPTYVTQVGTWTQIDDTVFFNIYVRISAIGGMTGNIQVAGLPKPSRNVANTINVHSTRWSSVTLTATGVSIIAQQSPNSDFFDMVELRNTAGAAFVLVTAVGAAADFIIAGSYNS